MKKKETRQLTLTLPPASLTTELIGFLEDNANRHPGTSELYFQLTDQQEGWQVKLRSFSKPIEVNDELTQYIGQQQVIDVHINIINN